MNPDYLYTSQSGNGNTFIYFPEKRRFLMYPRNKTHYQMIKNMKNPIDSAVSGLEGLTQHDLFGNYFKKNNQLPPAEEQRYRVQKHGDAVLGRSAIANEEVDVAIWPTSQEKYLNITTAENLITDLVKYPEYKNLKKAILAYSFDQWKPGDGEEDEYAYNQNKIVFDLKPKVKIASNTQYGKEYLYEEFIINGEKYTLLDLMKRRSDMHLRGMSYKDPVLCAINTIKYPQLKGYIPANCEEVPKKLEPFPNSEPRGEGDWRGQPSWKKYSEGLTFKKFISLEEQN